MKNRLPILKCTHMAKNILQDFTCPVCVLPHPVGGVGIGSHRDDLAAQFLKAAEEILCGQKTAAAVHAAGIELQAGSQAR